MNRTVAISLPMAAMLSVTAWSGYGMLAVMIWTAMGMAVFKFAGLRISADGLGERWTHGWRKVLLVSHRLCFWPYYLWLQRFAAR